MTEPKGVIESALAKARVVFWVCPIREHRRRIVDGHEAATVRWRDGVAYCLTEGCGRTSAQ